ncbi:MAG TPA: DUF4388 domain-containing protein [Ktedonobacteraceae bacterium]|nr:DUF4388 domain-containing protein [Ktedonobacteraceae bacterium]
MEQQDRIMDGDLQTLGLQSILKMLALSGKTGTLLVHSGSETLAISLRKGQIVALQDNGGPQPDILGMLCLINKLDPPRAQYLKEVSQGNIQLAFAVMVEQRWMTQEEMQHRLEFAVTQSISHALRWVDGRFSFHRQLVPMESRMRPLDIDSLLLEALRQADEWEEKGEAQMARTAVARWLPEVNKDVMRLGLSQEHIDVLCLANGEIPMQAVAMVLMSPEARIAQTMLHLLELNLIELVDTALEGGLQQDLSNIIIQCQHLLAQQRQNSNPDQHLLGLISILTRCINGLLEHHGKYARILRGRGAMPEAEVIRYLDRRFKPTFNTLGSQQYSIMETATFERGRLDCTDILNLDKLVKGTQLEEFCWEAVLGLTAFLRFIFTELLGDEVGNSHTGRQLHVVWRAFLTEVDQEIQQYQVFRAYRNTQHARGREPQQPSQIGVVQQWQNVPESDGGSLWSPETQRRSI